METGLLIAEARKYVGEFFLSASDLTAASVACALVTEAGNIHTGVCLSLSCGIGFCAEHSAIASMLQHRETLIRQIVAVSQHRVLAPCGRCRELMLQVNMQNMECEVILPDGSAKLRDLLPHPWM
jgi:cytidine deaminase